jgi:hypothetical protein
MKPRNPEKPSQEPQVERERTQFRALILQNPNYFGNLKVSPNPAPGRLTRRVSPVRLHDSTQHG